MRELDLLQRVYGFNAKLPESVTIAPGDDMGAIATGGESQVLVAVDQVADGVHFDRATTSLARIGRKAMTRNLSDIAAMAAQPLGAVVAVALPRAWDKADADALFDAMRSTGQAFGCPLFGGDVCMWDHPLLISVTVLAQPAGITPVRRSGAKVGDVICVTGRLGGSMETTPSDNGEPYTHHLDFEPRIALARALASDHDLHLHAMIDLSDGLAADLKHICRASQVSAELFVEALPISKAAHQAAHRNQVEPWRHALCDGEDYELCFTLDAAEADAALPATIDCVPITRIGVITPADDDEPAITLKLPDGTMQTLGEGGFEHGVG